MEFDLCVGTNDVNASQKLFSQLNDAQKKFDRALDQINVIDLQLRDLEIRYRRAVKHKKNSFRYNLRLKLSVVTGIKMMYNHFATKKAEEVRRCTRELEVIYGNEMHNFDPRDANSNLEPASQETTDNEASVETAASPQLDESLSSASASSVQSTSSSESTSAINESVHPS